MTILHLAKSAGVTTETVRYYQRIGLLRVPQRPGRGFRAYGESDVRRLQFIRRGQSLGFSLEEIGVLLQLSSAECADAEHIASQRLTSVREKIGVLRRLEATLQRAIDECANGQPYTGSKVIETVLQP